MESLRRSRIRKRQKRKRGMGRKGEQEGELKWSLLCVCIADLQVIEPRFNSRVHCSILGMGSGFSP